MSSETSEEPKVAADGEPTPDQRPVLRIVSGNPSADDLAVLTAVISAVGGDEEPEAMPRRGRWNDPAMLTRRTFRAGPGAWQAALR